MNHNRISKLEVVEQGDHCPLPHQFNSANIPLLWSEMKRGSVISLIPYTGGKSQLTPLFIPLLEWVGKEYELDTFVTATGGACRCLLNLDPDRLIYKNRIYSDVDYALCCLFYVLTDEYMTKDLIRYLDLTEFSYSNFKSAYSTWKHANDQASIGNFKQNQILNAASIFILATMSYAANMKSYSWGKAQWHDLIHKRARNLTDFNSMLSNVRIFRKDCRQLINEIESSHLGYSPTRTLIFADIPYDLDACSGKNYEHEWSRQDHINFREQVKQVTSKTIICGYSSKIYDELVMRYPDRWSKVFIAKRFISSSSSSKVYKNEWIYINFPINDEVQRVISKGSPLEEN